MASKGDPTRTATIRKAWISEINKRFNKLKGEINRFVLKNDPGDIVINQVFDFKSDPQAVTNFLLWLQTKIDQRIFDNEIVAGKLATDFWQNKYIHNAYERGVRVAQAELRKQKVPLASLLDQAQPAAIFGTATASLGIGIGVSTLGPIHLDAIQMLYTRDFTQLKGITGVMSSQIARILTEGVEQGLGAKETARNINNRVDKIGKARAKLLARTETVRAYNVGVINETEALAKEFGFTAKYEWVDSDDGRVRPTHVERDGKLFTAKEAFALIGEPNCRCSLSPRLFDDDGDPV